ncbi:MAG: branched-chain amino acid ABC transporter permease [Deltaproteobacteria bacterium]|nr:branched-chain amino acid ABC transporter permease [Deltaproteobacteria bacterium]MCZ6546646.1 branched-chain amino acid ABC transporter permease [Deltaproteobacteria bacterium]MCZ6563793.1 branched-chain amino acid ABC transporter permease [Deltaproteobacteria bacterium]
MNAFGYLTRPTPLVAMAVCAFLALVPPLFGQGDLFGFCMTMMFFIVLAYSLNMVTGFIGYLDFGHVVFLGLGAYSAGGLLSLFSEGPVSYNPYVWVILSGLIPAVFAVLVGYPALRIRGAYFAIATYSLNLAVQAVFFNWEIFGGSEGLPLNRYLKYVEGREIWGYYIYLGAMVAAFWVSYFTLKKKLGFGFRAILNDEDAAACMGVNTTAYKITAYAMGAFFAGIIGGTYGIFQNFVDPDNFRIGVSIELFVIMMVGGVGTALGPMLGGIIFYTIRDLLIIQFSHLHLIIFGAVVIVIVMFIPGGLVGSIREFWPKSRRYLE